MESFKTITLPKDVKRGMCTQCGQDNLPLHYPTKCLDGTYLGVCDDCYPDFIAPDPVYEKTIKEAEKRMDERRAYLDEMEKKWGKT